MRLEHLLSGETAIEGLIIDNWQLIIGDWQLISQEKKDIGKSGSLEPGASCTRNCLMIYRLGETVVISVRFRNLPSDERVQEIFDILTQDKL